MLGEAIGQTIQTLSEFGGLIKYPISFMHHDLGLGTGISIIIITYIIAYNYYNIFFKITGLFYLYHPGLSGFAFTLLYIFIFTFTEIITVSGTMKKYPNITEYEAFISDINIYAGIMILLLLFTSLSMFFSSGYHANLFFGRNAQFHDDN